MPHLWNTLKQMTDKDFLQMCSNGERAQAEHWTDTAGLYKTDTRPKHTADKQMNNGYVDGTGISLQQS